MKECWVLARKCFYLCIPSNYSNILPLLVLFNLKRMSNSNNSHFYNMKRKINTVVMLHINFNRYCRLKRKKGGFGGEFKGASNTQVITYDIYKSHNIFELNFAIAMNFLVITILIKINRDHFRLFSYFHDFLLPLLEIPLYFSFFKFARMSSFSFFGSSLRISFFILRIIRLLRSKIWSSYEKKMMTYEQT